MVKIKRNRSNIINKFLTICIYIYNKNSVIQFTKNNKKKIILGYV